MTDKVSLLKQDGTRVDNIRAQVGAKKIMIDDVKLAIEEGDLIERELPNGLTERFLVLDRGFKQGLGGPSRIPPHYQVEVRKESKISPANPRSVVYNLYGANPRVNNNSIDASMNVVNATPDDLFVKLREAITVGVDNDTKKSELLEHVAELEKTQGTARYVDKYKEFMSVLADHIGVVTPFLPALSQMIVS